MLLAWGCKRHVWAKFELFGSVLTFLCCPAQCVAALSGLSQPECIFGAAGSNFLSNTDPQSVLPSCDEQLFVCGIFCTLTILMIAQAYSAPAQPAEIVPASNQEIS